MTQALYNAMAARLASGGRQVFDGIQSATVSLPADSFVLLVESLATPERYLSTSPDVSVTIRTICASRTREGSRRMAEECRNLLTDWSPWPGLSDPLVEEDSGPVLEDGEGRDIRYSVTLVHRTFTPRSTV